MHLLIKSPSSLFYFLKIRNLNTVSIIYVRITNIVMQDIHVDELDHRQIHYNYCIQNVKADHNDYKVALLVILLHIFYMHQYELNLTTL